MVRAAVAYYTVLAFDRDGLAGHHRSRPLAREPAAWTRGAVVHLLCRRRDRKLQNRLKRERSKKYFLIGLQVFDDLQMHYHARGWTAERLLREAIRSFATHAPPDTWLIVKQHPLDLGHRSYVRLVDDAARTSGCADRVFYMHTGHAPTLLRHAAGLITINSTLGLSALHHGCPVLGLGDAFWTLPGLGTTLAELGSIDCFWSAPPAIDQSLARRFRRHVIDHSQLNGTFYNRRWWPSLAADVCERLEGSRRRLREPRHFSYPARPNLKPQRAFSLDVEPALFPERALP
jgi:capsule polysaccharide modification protein KpsS